MSIAADSQIAKWAAQAGWPVDQIPRVIGEAHGESGGDPSRDQIGGFGRGLMQIDIGQHPDLAKYNLHDPVTNLQLAKGIWDRQGWRAWYAPSIRQPSLDQVKSWLGTGGADTPPALTSAPSTPPAIDFGPLQAGITGAGTSIGNAFAGIPVQIGHGIAGGALTTLHNLETFAATQAVAIFVALVVVLVIFLK